MKLQDFLDLGFEITKTFENTQICVKVCKEEDLYKQVLEFAKEHKNYDDVKDYAHNLKCMLGFISYSGDELTGVELSTYKNGNRYNVAKDNVVLSIEIVDDVIVDVDEMLWYFHSFRNYNKVYTKRSIYDEGDVNEIMKYIYHQRLKNAQDIRNYYNKEIKSLKKNYKEALEKAKLGLNFLKQFEK